MPLTEFNSNAATTLSPETRYSDGSREAIRSNCSHAAVKTTSRGQLAAVAMQQMGCQVTSFHLMTFLVIS